LTVLGTPATGLYDWTDAGTEGELVSDARTAYGRAVAELRQRIADGRGLGAMTALARDLGADYAIVNRAFGQLAAEGLLLVEHGKRTRVPDRRHWSVAFGTPEVTTEEGSVVDARLQAAAAAQPMVSRARTAHESPQVLLVMMTVESADAGGAVTAALLVAREALGTLPVTGISVAAAG
jgi:DNA-binding FadR family transcriptional regulator